MHFFSVTFRIVGAIIFCMAIVVDSYAGQHDMSRAAIAERIKPVGEVNIAGEQAKVQTVAQTAGTAGATKQGVKEETSVTDGQAVYEQYCSVCHAGGLAGAPKIGDSKDWQGRTEKGMDHMLENVEKGFNAMPMKGTCMTCNREQLQAAVEYMLPK